jgi:hypothetical protein
MGGRVGRMIRDPKNQIRRMWARDNHGADISYRDLRETTSLFASYMQRGYLY